MLNIKLPVWANDGVLENLRIAATNYWLKVENWLQWPLQQIDPLTCSEGILNLIAWGRQIERFIGEPLTLYRKRVAYALPNAKDSGSKAGMLRIFERLGIEGVVIEERHPDKDFDVIVLRLNDQVLGSQPQLLELILNQYGRTCRRYEWTVVTPIDNAVQVDAFDVEYFYSECE